MVTNLRMRKFTFMRIATLAVGLLLALASCKSPKEKLIEDISSNEQKLFSDSTRLLNSTVAEGVLKSYREFVEKYPDDSLSVSYLYKGGDLANGMKNYILAIDLYRQFIEKYPDHHKAAAGLFMQAFIHDSNLHEKEKAKQLYLEFLKKYPGHELALSAQASLDQISMGLSDEQLIKMFEAKHDSLSKINQYPD